MDTLDEDSRKARVLVLYANPRWTHPVVESLVEELVRDGVLVERAQIGTGLRPPPPADYDAVVIGAPVRFGMLSHAVVDYIERHIDELEELPAYMFTVGSEPDAMGLVARATGWTPTSCRGIARPGWRTRWFGDPNAVRAQAVHALASEIVSH